MNKRDEEVIILRAQMQRIIDHYLRSELYMSYADLAAGMSALAARVKLRWSATAFR